MQQNGAISYPLQEKMLPLTLGALGVVFGDIGTSPLYALRECFNPAHGVVPSPGNVLGIVSLILWSLILIVTVKYVCIFLRASNRGEGGILALMTLVTQSVGPQKKYYPAIISLGILGAALLYGDGVITPVISVLSAVEGLTEATPLFRPFIVPLSLIILVALFLVQSKGSATVGSFFGPVLLLWFAVIGLLGFLSILRHPGVLAALNPYYACVFLFTNGLYSFKILGSAFLALTGAEVLYADLGHFGKQPIRRSWFYIVFPALTLNYLGQGAYLLSSPYTVVNLFYQLVPSWALYPVVVLATMATVIASQAVITGAFSLARQGVQLGFFPRIRVSHTSSQKIGQVYVPLVNWGLLAGTVLLIITFRESGKLAGAYGIAVSAAMFITTVLILFVARKQWHVSLAWLIPLGALFLCIQLAFFSANVLKVTSGGWIVLLITGVIYLFMKTWLDGRAILRKNMVARAMKIETLLELFDQHEPLRVPGIAVFLNGTPDIVPNALIHNLKHNKVLHEHTVILCVRTEEIPYVHPEDRVKIQPVGKGLYQVFLNFGFSETPNIPQVLQGITGLGFQFTSLKTTYFLGRESLVVSGKRTMQKWRKRIFWFMSHNALNATSFFGLPPNRVVEIGSQLEL